MSSLRPRNLQILQLSREGVHHREIARRFQVCRTNVDGIVRRLVAEEELERKIGKLCEHLRQVDDLNREWPTGDLTEALRLGTTTRKALMGRFEAETRNAISLRNLMEMAVSHADDAGLEDHYPELLKIRNIGSKGFWSIIHGISNLNLDERCAREWERRLSRLRRVWKIKGDFPYSPLGQQLQMGRIH